MKNKFMILFLAGLLILSMLACASSTAVPVTPTPTKTSVPQPTATLPPQPTDTQSSRCQPASAQQAQNILDGIQDVSSSNNIGPAWAVKSGNFENVWFVAAEITGPGILTGQAIGLWAITGDPDKPGLTFSANPFAVQFSAWGDGSKTDAMFSQFDDGGQEAIACATP
jgi:hypothetical protein